MNSTEIKKELYRNKPIAKFEHIRKGHALYKTLLQETVLYFSIPVSDMGDATFSYEMESQTLIRWLSLVSE